MSGIAILMFGFEYSGTPVNGRRVSKDYDDDFWVEDDLKIIDNSDEWTSFVRRWVVDD